MLMGINININNYKHALKNGLIPVITITCINVGTLIAFFGFISCIIIFRIGVALRAVFMRDEDYYDK